jgi:hypothetical protein
LRKFKNFQSNSNILFNPFKPTTKNSKNNFSYSFSAFSPQSPAATFLFPFYSHQKLPPTWPCGPTRSTPATFFLHPQDQAIIGHTCAAALEHPNRPAQDQTSPLDSSSVFPI